MAYTSIFLIIQHSCRQAGKVPGVEFCPADGSTLDICHLAQLAEKWLAVAYFRDPKTRRHGHFVPAVT
jgi:hypothetical protein